MPRVSLMVPVFNRADLLADCLDSALRQTMGDIEIVVVDGASTDGTWDVCRRYAQADGRVRIFRETENLGPVVGWWRCVQEARGELATFLWSDDLLLPTFLESTVPRLSDPSIGFAFTAVEIGASPGDGAVSYQHSLGEIASGTFIQGTLAATGQFPVSPACAVFRLSDIKRSFLMELPTSPTTDLRDTGAGVDMLLFLQTALRYPRVAVIHEPLAFFRAHPGSITVQGRGGRVALNYAVTRGWFSAANGYRDLARVVLTRQWIWEMRTSGRFVNPIRAAQRYGRIVGGAELVVTLLTLAGAKVVRTLSMPIRPRPAGSP